jgi:hypothetical protein
LARDAGGAAVKRIADLRSFLKQQAAKPPARASSAYRAITELLPEILALKRRRYTDREICDFLAEKELNMTLGTFQQYFSRAKRVEATKDIGSQSTESRVLPSARIIPKSGQSIGKKISAAGHRLNEEL